MIESDMRALGVGLVRLRVRDLGRENFDESLQEPMVLPTKLPNLLVNGSAGIAVGMATNIPPHNLSEVVDGLVMLVGNPEATVDGLMRVVPGPDFPTAGYIYGRQGIGEAYTTGRGIITLRAKAHVEKLRGGREAITVTIAGAHDHPAATGPVTLAHPLHTIYDAGGREVRRRHELQQLVDGERRVVEQRQTGVDHLAEIVRREIGGHPHPEIETFPNQYKGYEITIEIPEYTAICPKTKLPDFGTITLHYMPDKECLEFKALKMYIHAYRNLGIFYENAVNRILHAVVKACHHVWARVTGTFTARGGLLKQDRSEVSID